MRIDRQRFLAVSGVHAARLEIWIEQQWLVPTRESESDWFSDVDIARARLIRELQDDMGANDAGVDIILHLMDQLHGMRQALEDVRGSLREQGSQPPRAKAGVGRRASGKMPKS